MSSSQFSLFVFLGKMAHENSYQPSTKPLPFSMRYIVPSGGLTRYGTGARAPAGAADLRVLKCWGRQNRKKRKKIIPIYLLNKSRNSNPVLLLSDYFEPFQTVKFQNFLQPW